MSSKCLVMLKKAKGAVEHGWGPMWAVEMWSCFYVFILVLIYVLKKYVLFLTPRLPILIFGIGVQGIKNRAGKAVNIIWNNTKLFQIRRISFHSVGLHKMTAVYQLRSDCNMGLPSAYTSLSDWTSWPEHFFSKIFFAYDFTSGASQTQR